MPPAQRYPSLEACASSGVVGVGHFHGMNIPHQAAQPVQLIKQIVWSIIDSGFRRILVVRGCGGHWAVPGALWDVKADTRRAGRDLTLRVIGVADDWAEVTARHLPGGDGGHAAVYGTRPWMTCSCFLRQRCGKNCLRARFPPSN